MRITTRFARAGWLAAAGFICLTQGLVWADDDKPKKSPDVGPYLNLIKEHQRRDSHKYWLNAHIGAISPELADQLQLTGGVLIEKVGPDGPADKAGLKAHDIVLSVGETAVKNSTELADAVDAAEGKELTLKVLRAGKPTTVTVTPEKRSKGPGAKVKLPAHELVDLQEIRDVEKAIRGSLEQLKGIADLKLQFVKPGTDLSNTGVIAANAPLTDFPDDLDVTVHKQGKKPAEIEIKQGDKSWKVKAGELGELPDDVRKHVEGMLGQRPLQLKILSDKVAWQGQAEDTARRLQVQRRDFESRLQLLQSRLQELVLQANQLSIEAGKQKDGK